MKTKVRLIQNCGCLAWADITKRERRIKPSEQVPVELIISARCPYCKRHYVAK